MRKLLILASAVALACSANAASYLWGLTGGEIITPTGTYDNDDYLDGGTAFLFLGTVTASANAFDFSNATLITTSGMDGNYKYGNFDEDSLGSSDSITSTAAGQNFAIILIEKDNAALSDLQNIDASAGLDYVLYTGTSVQGEIADPSGGDSTFYAKMYDAGSTYEGQWAHMSPADPDPIPEPTSGLLVLLGVAGLALKRKRA